VVEVDTKTVAAVGLACATGAVGAGTCSAEQLTRAVGRSLAEACAVEAGAWVEPAGIALGGGAVEKFLDLGEHHYPQSLEACAEEHSGLLFCSAAMLGIMHTHTADEQQVVPLLDPGG
jgi:hypothetical protein